MEIKPDVVRLMKRDAYGWGLVTGISLLFFLILQTIITLANPEVDAHIFVRYVWSWVVGGLTLTWMIWPWFAWFWYVNLSYSLREERIILRKGILNKKEVSVPYRAVTDFTLRQGFFERRLGMGAILVQTAGQSVQPSGYEAKLEGLENFAELHRELRGRLQAGKQVLTEAIADDAPFSTEQLLAAILAEIRSLREDLEKRVSGGT